MTNNEFERAARYGTSAMGLLKKATIPPYPQFYELLYTYASGVNPALNARINSYFADSNGPTTDVAEKLYQEFLRTTDVEERLSNVSNEISEKIQAVNTAINSAMDTAHSYSGSLEQAKEDLDKDLDKATLKALAMRLLNETKSMQEDNRHLELRLENSRTDINLLQRDLDEVRRESMLDPLTKIYNRKCFDQGLARAIVDSEQSDAPLTLILIDIDHFKSFNDKYGHQTGDQVLRLVAMTLKSNVKSSDLAARYGGEEFAIVLPGMNLANAHKLADTIRKAIQSKELLKRSTNQKLGRITASFGIAALRSEDTQTSLIERADLCLYAAKALGRNSVVDETDDVVIKDVSAA